MGLGAAFGIAAAGYEIGAAVRMGPGYFPLVLATALVLLGAAVVIKGLRATSPEAPIGALPWRALALVLGAVVFFGATVRGLGLAPSLFLTVLAASLASPENTPARAAALALGITALCVLIFSLGLGVPLALRGPWLGG